MKVSTFVMCTLAVVLWVGASALAEGKGKAWSDKATVKDSGGKGGQVEKQAGAQAKKVGQATEAAQKGQGKGKGQDQQAQAFQKQLQREQGKHMERLARLNRLREIYEKKGDKEKVAQVEKLIAKENEVNSRKFQRMQGQPRAYPPTPTGMEKAAEKAAAPAVTPPASTPPAPVAPATPPQPPAEPQKEKAKEQK